MLEAREDKPITKLRTTIVNADGVTVLDGHAVVWTEPVAPSLGGRSRPERAVRVVVDRRAAP